MRMRTKLIGLAGVVAVVGAGVLAASPALAEGQFNTQWRNAYINSTTPAYQDSQIDNVSTQIVFSGCSYSNGLGFSSVGPQLWDQHGAFPDTNVGEPKTNSCGSSSWSHSSYSFGSDTYFVQLVKFNNSYSAPGITFTADSTTYY